MKRRSGLANVGQELVDVLEHPLRHLVGHLPGVGQLHPSAGAVEEGGAQRLLETADLDAQGRLGDHQFPGPPR